MEICFERFTLCGFDLPTVRGLLLVRFTINHESRDGAKY